MRLKGKIAIVTGAGSGIGHATAALFAREGACVLVADLVGERAKGVASDIQELGGAAEAFVGDVSSEKDAEQMAARADKLWNRLDILVNNAASFHHRTAEEATKDDWERVLSVNVMGTSAHYETAEGRRHRKPCLDQRAGCHADRLDDLQRQQGSHRQHVQVDGHGPCAV